MYRVKVLKAVLLLALVLLFTPAVALAGNPLIITFGPPQLYATGNYPDSVAMGDLTGDGTMDLVVANLLDNTVSVLLGNGDGTFQPQAVYPTCTLPVQVVITDMNQDGKPDLVVLCTTDQGADWVPSTVSVLLGNGDGTFQTHNDYSTQVGTWQSSGEYVPTQLLVGDLNGDGYPDVVTLGYGARAGDVHVLLNAGAGQNGVLQPVMLADSALADGGTLLDIKGDGTLDLAYVLPFYGVWWALGDGNGHFTNDQTQNLCTSAESCENYFPGVIAGDVNGDGKPDLVVSMGGEGPCTMINEGNGNFTTCQYSLMVPQFSNQIALADFNNGGRMDLLTMYIPYGGDICESITLQVLLGHGHGTFQVGPTLLNDGDENCDNIAGSFNFAIGDLNGDGLPDVAMTSQNGGVQVFLNTSSTPDQAPVASNASFGVQELNGPQPLNDMLTARSPVDNPLTFTVVNAPTHGTVQITDISTGAFTYVPAANFPSSGDSFTFNANDGYMTSNTATVTLTAASTSNQSGGKGKGGGGGLDMLGLGVLGMIFLRKRRRA
ncbi:MAG: FG-GAP-like repeat-containing protein [Gammaproteobacteria bacterium]